MGLLDGVVSTTPGWIQKVEVVEVEFDPKRLALEELVKKADACDCALQVFTRTDAQQDVARQIVGERAVRTDEAVRLEGDKYYLAQTALRFLPLTPLQAARVNIRVGAKEDFVDLLSPRQRALLRTIEANPQAGWESAIRIDFHTAWHMATRLADALQPSSPTR